MKDVVVNHPVQVEVFKTNVQETAQVKELQDLLAHYFPGSRITVDLQDCDKVLRVEGRGLDEKRIMRLVQESGFYCQPLP